jgi:hypothetical protein
MEDEGEPHELQLEPWQKVKFAAEFAAVQARWYKLQEEDERHPEDCERPSGVEH